MPWCNDWLRKIKTFLPVVHFLSNENTRNEPSFGPFLQVKIMQLCTFLSWFLGRLLSWFFGRFLIWFLGGFFTTLETPRHVGYCFIITTTSLVLALFPSYPIIATIFSLVWDNFVTFVIWKTEMYNAASFNVIILIKALMDWFIKESYNLY